MDLTSSLEPRGITKSIYLSWPDDKKWLAPEGATGCKPGFKLRYPGKAGKPIMGFPITFQMKTSIDDIFIPSGEMTLTVCHGNITMLLRTVNHGKTMGNHAGNHAGKTARC